MFILRLILEKLAGQNDICVLWFIFLPVFIPKTLDTDTDKCAHIQMPKVALLWPITFNNVICLRNNLYSLFCFVNKKVIFV